jgi:hypothetical protein
MVLATAPASRSGCQAPRIAFELHGGLYSEQRVGVELFIGRRMLEVHLLEIHLELFSDEHRN